MFYTFVLYLGGWWSNSMSAFTVGFLKFIKKFIVLLQFELNERPYRSIAHLCISHRCNTKRVQFASLPTQNRFGTTSNAVTCTDRQFNITVIFLGMLRGGLRRLNPSSNPPHVGLDWNVT